MMELRPATQADAQQLFEWRNNPETRRFSHDSGELNYESHVVWLEGTLASKDRKLFIARVDGTDVGTCRMDFSTDKKAEISWTVSPGQRGKGYAKKMIRALIDSTNKDIQLMAEIKRDNTASVRIAESVGMRLVKEEGEILFFSL